jgi:hypothetical protein
MALVDGALAGALKSIFKQMRDPASENPKGDDWYADQLAKAIDDQIKTGDVQTGISVAGTCPDGPVTARTITLGVIR